MSFTLELNWQALIEDVAGPMSSHDSRESWLDRAARRADLSHRQIRGLYYGECHDPRISVAYSVLLAADQARSEAARLAEKFENLAGALNADSNSDRNRSDVLALINAARALRGLRGP